MSKLLLNNVNIVNPNESIKYNHNILIDNNKILEISKNKITSSKDIKTIECADKFILPGFIDMHNHIMANGFDKVDNMKNPLAMHFYNGLANMKNTLHSGITTLRDCGLADFGVKLAASKKLFLSPKLHISVTPLSITGGHYDFYFNSGFDMELLYPGMPKAICDGVEGVLKKTREIMRARADFIKVMVSGGVLSENDSPTVPQFNKKELKTILCEAKTRNLKVSAHAHGLDGIKNAIDVGLDSIDHGTFIDKQSAIKMHKKDIALIPTLSVVDTISKGSTFDEEKKSHIKQLAKVHKENIAIAYDNGVNILMGTDCGVTPHGNNLRELELLTQIGLSNEEAIASGTINAAKFLNLDNEIGSSNEGKIADMILVNDNPIDNIKILSDSTNIDLVIQDGIIVKNKDNL
ncbi:amidohydrolase family protein [Methanobrevibacter sp. DSM 116169]|uniref:metal-dependent hydrolase family protein n=1 Tax=Methanobrevibacter sp. DSM 116169 TaxID=3242727 RepID=UPI0038FD0D5F